MVHDYDSPRVFHVKTASGTAPQTVQPSGQGTAEQPFTTINQAAAVARPGDRVVVHAGTYREQVDPQLGGSSTYSRIVYEAAPGERPVIKGSEPVNDWVNDGGSVWKAVLPNSLFGAYNPFAISLDGDWVETPLGWKLTLGDVYLNGKSFYQVRNLADVRTAEQRQTGPGADWRDHVVPLNDPEGTVYQWYAEVDRLEGGQQPDPAGHTTIWANFQGADPTDPANLVEVNVRQACFYPSRTGRNYITVRGFEMAQAACGWAPPTGDQVGLIGPHWSKGWIIEDNIIHDAKCSAVSLGKEYSTGDQDAWRAGRKPGYQRQLEAVFIARHIGWSKETVGSHIVRNNRIYDCGQNGVVGHLGCVFSIIENNDIYRIGAKREWFGHEIAGIKLHAALDTVLRGNRVHDCSLGTWLDWQAQGTRVTSNIYYRNERDLMIEVTHGPCLFDNNIFASHRTIDNWAQGSAFVHNLFLGGWIHKPVLNRSTPYHYPHSTEVLGYACVYSGDDRFYQNIFVGGDFGLMKDCVWGTASYDGAPTSTQDYLQQVHYSADGQPLIGDISLFEAQRQPSFMAGNVYLNGCPSFDGERAKLVSQADPAVQVVEEADGSLWFEGDFEPGFFELPTSLVSTQSLGCPRLTTEPYENPDGSPITVERDLLGAVRNAEHPTPGPLEALQAGHNRIRLA